MFFYPFLLFSTLFFFSRKQGSVSLSSLCCLSRRPQRLGLAASVKMSEDEVFWHAKALIRSYTDYIKKVVSSADGSLESRRKHLAERLSNLVQGAERGVLTAHLLCGILGGLGASCSLHQVGLL